MGLTPNHSAYKTRRRWERHSLNASIRVVTDTSVIDGRGVRMSEGGICLFALADLPIGTQVKVEFSTPRSRKLIRVRGAIRNRAVYLYGVEFLAEEFEDRQQIAELGDVFRGHGGSQIRQ